jgi:hypothetical protein
MCVAADYYKFFSIAKFNQICQKERPQKIGNKKYYIFIMYFLMYCRRIRVHGELCKE